MNKRLHDAIRKTPFWRLVRRCFLEIHLAEHCNLNCIGCSHFSPLAEPAFCDLEELRNNLQQLSKFKSAFRAIRLLGGEPLLNPEISEIMRIVCTNFKDSDIELVTNGILFLSDAKKIPDHFWETCRQYNVRINITIYPLENIDYAKIERICIQNNVRFRIYANRRNESSFQCFKLDPNGGGDRAAYAHCDEAKCWQLVGNRIYACPQSAYVGYLNKAFGSNFVQRKGDFIEINKLNKLRLLLFKLRSKPFCSYCVFPRMNINWKQSERNADEWIL